MVGGAEADIAVRDGPLYRARHTLAISVSRASHTRQRCRMPRTSRGHRSKKRTPRAEPRVWRKSTPNPYWARVRAFAAKDEATRGTLSSLSNQQILEWADAYRARTGDWPRPDSGPIHRRAKETWMAVEAALSLGLRGLPGGDTLRKLLARERGRRHKGALPPITVRQILRWADTFHKRNGFWPDDESGPIADAPGETWKAVQVALVRGGRGLPCRSSLAKLFQEHRGVRNFKDLPRLTVEEILSWADTHRERTGVWPKPESGTIAASPAETWMAVDMALRAGCRGLAGGSSLPRLLAERRAAPYLLGRAALSVEKILAWADAHHQRTGRWPKALSGEVADAPGETWGAISAALCTGARGLPGGSTLPQLLAKQRGVRNHRAASRLSVDRILAWADAHHEQTGAWPTQNSGSIASSPGETWSAIDYALREGLRGLWEGTSLSKLLAAHRQVPPRYARCPRRPKLSERACAFGKHA